MSINVARLQLPGTVSSSIMVVADRCSDDTADIALKALGHRRRDLVIAADVGRAGTARRVGTRAVLDSLSTPANQTWIANTDADTVVPPDWLTTHLRHAQTGHVAVAGVVNLHPATIDDPSLHESFDSYYVHYPDGTHPHVHGANLGFRADAYRAVGGWNPLATGEDHDLWNRLRRHGSTVSTTALTVATSARRIGRAPEGLASDLAALCDVAETVA